MQHQHKPNARTRQLRLVTDNDNRATANNARASRARPALGVWSLTSAASKPLPRELARQLIEHYTDRGSLVLAAPRARDTLAVASKLDRRALPLTARTRTSTDGVLPLRANERAALAVAILAPAARARSAATLAARACERLEPGGFLALALDGAHGPLGPIVRASEQQGVQYWQHIIALDPSQLANANAADAGAAVHTLRCHRDVLVFRRPAQTNTLADEAVSAAVAA